MNKKEIKAIERKAVEGYDDFKNYLCIHKEDWEKLKERYEE